MLNSMDSPLQVSDHTLQLIRQGSKKSLMDDSDHSIPMRSTPNDSIVKPPALPDDSVHKIPLRRNSNDAPLQVSDHTSSRLRRHPGL